MNLRPLSRIKGVTLIEVIVFLVVIGIALASTLRVFSQNITSANDPIIRLRALELAQAQLDEVLARKFDENTPTGGVPACGSTDPSASACLGIVSDAGFDDVGDYNGFVDTSHTGYNVAVSVADAGGEIGLAAASARRITVTVSTPAISSNASGSPVTLSAYRVNF